MNTLTTLENMVAVLGWERHLKPVSDPIGFYGKEGYSLTQDRLDALGLKHENDFNGSEELTAWVGVTTPEGAGICIYNMGVVSLIYIYGKGCKWLHTEGMSLRRRFAGELTMLIQLCDVSKESPTYQEFGAHNNSKPNHYACMVNGSLAKGVDLKVEDTENTVSGFYATQLESLSFLSLYNELTALAGNDKG